MPQNFNDFYSNQFALQNEMVPTIPSLAEQKAALLAKRKEEKVASLDPEVAADKSAQKVYDEIYGPYGGDSGTVDAIQSSLVQTAGNLYDMGSNIYNRVADNTGLPAYDKKDFIGKEVDTWSDQKTANKITGYDPTNYNKKMKQFENSFDNGNYWEALKTGVTMAPETLAQSAGPISEVAVGAALAPETGGASLFGVLGHLATKAPRVAKIVEAGYIPLKNTLLYGADIANQHAQEYEKATGEKKSIASILSDTLISSAIGAADINIFKYAVKTGTLGILKDTTKDLLRAANPTKSVVKNIATNVSHNAAKIASTGGSEYAQEYLETWNDILASSDKSLYQQLTDKENQSKANKAAALGFITGGTAVGAPAIASSASIGTINTARGVATKVGKKAQAKMLKSNLRFLSEEQKTKIYNKYKETEAQYENTINANNQAIDRIKNAEDINTLKAFQDPEIESAIDDVMNKDSKIKNYKKAIKEATDFNDLPKNTLVSGYLRDIQKEYKGDTELTFDEVQSKLLDKINNGYKETDLNANLDKIKNKAIASYNKKNTTITLARKYSKSKDIAGEVLANTYETSRKALDKIMPKETRDAIIEQASKGVDLAKNGLEVTVEEAKNINKSAARGVIDDIAKGKMNDVVSSYSKKQLIELKKGFKDNKKANKLIDNLIKKREKIESSFSSYLKDNKDKSVLDKLVDSYGNVANTELAVRLKGAMSITKDALTDSDRLSRYKKLVKSLEEEKKNNPEEFRANDGDKRLKRAYKTIAEAKKNNEQGLINNTIKAISKIAMKNKPKSKEAYVKAVKSLKKYYKNYSQKSQESLNEYLKRIEEYDIEAKINDVVDNLEDTFKQENVDTTSLKPIKDSIKQEQDTINKTKEAKPSKEKVSDKPIYKDSDLLNEDSLNRLTMEEDFDTIARNLTDKQINAMLNSNNENIASVGEMLKETKNSLPKEDKDISDLPDRPLTNKELSEKEKTELAEKLCKG